MLDVHEQMYATSSDKRLIIKYKNNFLDQGEKELTNFLANFWFQRI